MGKARPASPAPPEAPAGAVHAGAIPVLPEGWIRRHAAGKRELPRTEPPNTSGDSPGAGVMWHKQEPGGCWTVHRAWHRTPGLVRAELLGWHRRWKQEWSWSHGKRKVSEN